jgi:phage terminase large subunit-like protein
MGKVYAGLDLPTTQIASLVVAADNHWQAFFWLPEERLPINPFLRMKYLQWNKSGLLKLTPGKFVDYDLIIGDISVIKAASSFTQLAFDRWGSTEFIRRSKAGVEVIGVGQGFMTFAPLCQQYIRSKPVFDNPILQWMDKQLKFKTDPMGHQRPDRSQNEVGGIVAGLMAMSLQNIS